MSDPTRLTPPADAPDLDNLARLEAAATPAPWSISYGLHALAFEVARVGRRDGSLSILAGEPGQDMMYEATGSIVADAAFIAVTGMIDDETETPADYRERLSAGVARDLEMICANPDRVVQRGDKLIWCGGALAELYESLGGRVTMAGKPFDPIYELALAEGERLLGRPVDRARVLCIGDGVITDVLGADKQALDCLFIAQGIHGDSARGADGRLDPARAADLLKAEATHARYAALDLAW